MSIPPTQSLGRKPKKLKKHNKIDNKSLRPAEWVGCGDFFALLPSHHCREKTGAKQVERARNRKKYTESTKKISKYYSNMQKNVL